MVTEYLDYAKYNNGWIISKISGHARKKMFKHFMHNFQPIKNDRILDVGVTPDNAKEANNFFEKMYPWKSSITMCTVENAKNLEKEFPGSKFIQNEAGKPLPFKNGQFDIVFCSAVLEHVGNNKKQRFFLRELIRVGKRVYLTTPNRWFPFEVHTVLPFIHWLPQPQHQRILKLLGKNMYADTKNLNLLSKRKLTVMLQSMKIPMKWKFSSYKLFGNRITVFLTDICRAVTGNSVLYVIYWRTGIYNILIFSMLGIILIKIGIKDLIFYIMPFIPIVCNLFALFITSGWPEYRYFWPSMTISLLLLCYFILLKMSVNLDEGGKNVY